MFYTERVRELQAEINNYSVQIKTLRVPLDDNNSTLDKLNEFLSYGLTELRNEAQA